MHTARSSVAALAFVLAAGAWAQAPGGQRPNQPPRQGGPLAGLGAFTPTQVVAAGEDLIVLRGNLLLRYDASDLRQTHKVTLPDPPPPAELRGRTIPVVGALAANKAGVYVALGPTLYHYAAADLKPKGQLALAEEAAGGLTALLPSRLLATDTTLYVLRGNSLFAFADGLKQRAKVVVTTEGARPMDMMGSMMGSNALVLVGDCLFVNRGGVLYQFDPADLKAQGKVTLPEPPKPAAAEK